jgi:uncharacterized protein YceK
MRTRTPRSAIFAPVFASLLALLLTGCESIPTHVEGRKVTGVTQAGGQRAYIVESAEADRIAALAGAAESRAAAGGIVFSGTK